MTTSALTYLRTRSSVMVEAVSALVAAESPSADHALVAACAEVVATLGTERLGSEPEVIRSEGQTHVRWRFGAADRLVLLGHFDTVWPVGTVARRPFIVDGDVMRGPGCFDMKAGTVQLIEAVATLEKRDGLTILLTSDEEIGSPTSRALVEESARGAIAALVLEPSAGGALKIARKGSGTYLLRVTGRAAHAGNEPHKGANALVAASQLVLAATRLARPELGTTVTPTTARAGTASNVVPAEAEIELDVRVEHAEEAARVDEALRALFCEVAETTVSVEGGMNRPPLPASASSELFGRAQRVAETLGLGALDGVAVGGGSDGNLTAAIGVPTLDGLGAVGDGAHADHEWASISAMPERAALVAALVAELLG